MFYLICLNINKLFRPFLVPYEVCLLIFISFRLSFIVCNSLRSHPLCLGFLQTIAVVSVVPHGVIQLGSLDEVRYFETLI